MIELLFSPFQTIKKDSSIIIYGAGLMGGKMLKFIEKTEYCKIICFLDKNYENKKNFPYKVLAPQEITNISGYSYVLVSMLLPKLTNEANETLIALGIPKEKIIFLNNNEVLIHPSCFFKPIYLTELDNKPLKIAFVLCGALGDDIIASLLIKEIRKLIPDALVDCYSSQQVLFLKMPFINVVYPLSKYKDENNYDAIFNVRRFVSFEKINLEKIKIHSEKLYEFCIDCINICDKISGWIFNDRCYSDYCLLLGKNRLEQSNPHGILPYNRYSSTYMEWNEDAFKKLTDFNLQNKIYITICNNVNETGIFATKTWEVEKFNNLINLIKEKYPDLTIVWLGTSYKFGKLENIDVDLIGKTNFEELCVLLKYSLLNISVEGGLVHLKHFLNGKSVCLFGPTNIKFLGYEENINIKSNYSEKCSNGCEWITANNNEGNCLLAEKPICMQKLEPKVVYEKISEYIDNLPDYSYKLERVFEFNCENDLDSVLNTIIEQKKQLNIALIYNKYYNTVLSSLEKTNCNLIIYGRSLLEIEQEFVNSEYGFIYNIPAKDNTFDITLNFSLPDLKYPQFALNEALRVTKENGIVLIQQDKSLSVIKKEKQNAK